MKRLYPLLLTLSVLFVFTSCRKDQEPEVPTPALQVLEQGSNDETARTEYDFSVESAFKALENTNFGSRGSDSGGVILPCGVVSIDTTGGNYAIKYGKNCGKKVLSGSISATLVSTNSAWQDKGAVMRLDYNNYTVKFDVNNETLVFNGSLFVTNVDGGLLFEIISKGKTITHGIKGELFIQFDNGKTRRWFITKRRVYRSSSSSLKDLQVALQADAANNVAETGVNKEGNSFETTIPQELVLENCNTNGSWTGPFVMTTGKLVHTVGSNSLTAEPGHTYNNGSITKVNDCSSTGYKLTWIINGSKSEQFQYY